MIDTSKAKWNLSKEEKYAIAWLDEKGFDVKLEKQFISKAIFAVSKDGVTDSLELAQEQGKIGEFMQQYEKRFLNLLELKALKKELKDSQATKQ